MIIDAVVNDEGTLVAKAPEYLRGKNVRIVIKSKNKSLTDWNLITAALEKADHLNIPRRSLKEIISDLRAFRETL
jgi:hypothetical protein